VRADPRDQRALLVFQVPLVQSALVDLAVPVVRKVCKVKLDLKAPSVRPEMVAYKVYLVMLDLSVPRASPVLLARQARKVFVEPWVKPAHKARRVFAEPKVPRVFPAMSAQPDLLDLLVSRVAKVSMASKVQSVPRAAKAHKVLKVPADLRVPKARLDHPVPLETRAPKVLLGQRVRKVLSVLKVRLDLRARWLGPLVLTVAKVPKVIRVNKDPRVKPVPKVFKVLRVPRAPRARLIIPSFNKHLSTLLLQNHRMCPSRDSNPHSLPAWAAVYLTANPHPLSPAPRPDTSKQINHRSIHSHTSS